jgi:DNA-binding phage protein
MIQRRIIMERKIQRISRDRRLTPEEVARDEEVRRKVMEEFPPSRRVSEPVAESIAEALKQAIRNSGRSVYQIAKESGISQIVIARFLSGERDIRMATADKIAKVLALQLSAGR